MTTIVVKEKAHRMDGLFNLVAWGGIEPPTQGFSIPDTPTLANPLLTGSQNHVGCLIRGSGAPGLQADVQERSTAADC